VRRAVGVFALPFLAGCGSSVCGTADYTLLYGGGDAALLWDEDADGTADLTEKCGPVSGSFGLRRGDLAVTEVFFDPAPYGNDFEEALSVSTYLLPAGSLTFLTEHLEEGAVIGMGSLAGSGLHHLGGTAGETYATYGLLDAEITVVDGPRKSNGTVAEMSNAEQWRLAWRVEFGDTQSQQVLQTWDAEDWVEVSDGTEIGDLVNVPPDMPASG